MRVSLAGGGFSARDSNGWTISVWLLGTDDKEGFKDVNFTYVTQSYVFQQGWGDNPWWTNNWTYVYNFSSLVVNGSTIVLPQWVKNWMNGGAGWLSSVDWGNVLKWTAIGIFALLVLAIVAKAYFNRGGHRPLIRIKRRR